MVRAVGRAERRMATTSASLTIERSIALPDNTIL
jgi:hypothetical protein